MVRGLLLGLGIGILAGWLLFGMDSPPPRQSREQAVVPEESTAPETESAPPSRVESSTGRAPFPPDSPAGFNMIRSPDGRLRILFGGQELTARPVEEIDASLEGARAEKNWPEYLACILEYALHDSPAADRRLIGIMGDRSLSLPGPWIGDRFKEALGDSEVDGIAAAARARALVELEEKAGTRWEGRGFLTLVAKFGNASDIAWLDTLRTDRNRSREIDRALAEGAANLLVADQISRSILESRQFDYNHWKQFASSNPDAAHACAARILERGTAATNAYCMLGRATTPETLARTRDLLSAIASEDRRLKALYAVEEMRRHEIDTHAFETIIDTPRRILTRPTTTREERLDARRAIQTLSSCPVAWTDANLDALRKFAPSDDEKLAAHASSVLERIESKQAEADGWEPERDS